MAIKSIVVHFLMGSGGNLLKNIFSLAPGYELLGVDRTPVAQEEKILFLTKYYNQPVTRDSWLPREWSIRQALYNRYYKNSTASYWNPDSCLVYDNHGDMSITDMNTPLAHCNRYQVESGIIPEQLSDYTLADCHQVFIDTNNLKLINEIYASKNYDDESVAINTKKNYFLNYKLHNLKQLIPHQAISAESLLLSSLPIFELVNAFELLIDPVIINQIHSKWLQSTRDIYYNYYHRELNI